MRANDLLLAVSVLKNVRQWKAIGREEGCMVGLDVLKKFGLNLRRRKMAGRVGAMTNRRDPAQDFVVSIEKIERRSVEAEQLRQLAQSTVERIAEIQRFAEGVGDGIEDQQFSIAAANFVLGALPFADVKKKALVGSDIPRDVSDGIR